MIARPLATDLPAWALQTLAHATPHPTYHLGRRTVWHAWGQGGPVVLLHGGSGSWTHWVRNVQALAATGRQVWVPDLPGFGDSDLPADGGDADAMAAPLADGLLQLLAGRSFDLVGFSFGGLVASLLASQQPPGLRRLVFVGAPVFTLGRRSVRLLEWRHLDDEAQRAAIHHGNLAALMLRDPAAITPEVVALHAANMARDRLRRRRLAHTDAMARALAQVSCPMDAIYGREDALFRDRWGELESALDTLAGLRSRVFIDGAGHWVQFEAATAFNEALARCLNS